MTTSQSNLQDASAGQIREFLYWLVDTAKPGHYRVRCRSAKEAVSLRNRFNRVRATDRDVFINSAKEMGRVIDEAGSVGPLDQFVFRVVDDRVVITLAGLDIDQIKRDFIRDNQLDEALAPPPPPSSAGYEAAEDVTAPGDAERQREERDYANTSLI